MPNFFFFARGVHGPNRVVLDPNVAIVEPHLVWECDFRLLIEDLIFFLPRTFYLL
jgi:hypothetical protein